jgi:two-component system alkaline phosphatase synthesis response regulator PhoP
VHKLIEKNVQLQERTDRQICIWKTPFFKALRPLTKMSAFVLEKESMLLKLLIENKNEVVKREKILQTVWGYSVYPNTRTIDNLILNFRKYFEEDSRNPRHFHSVRGVGYKYTE